MMWATGLVGGCLFLFGLVLDDLTIRLISKPLPMLAMLAWVLARGRHLTYGKLLAAGLGLSLAGDVILEIGPELFLFGMIAFALAHVAYVAAFLWRRRGLRVVEALPFVLWVGWMASTLWPKLGPMQIPVTVYACVIGVMMWRATALAAAQEKPSPWDMAAMVGAITFGLSDSLIAINKFHTPFTGARPAIILTYWAGQLLLTLSLQSLLQEEGETP